MRHRNVWICLLTALLLAAAVFAGKKEAEGDLSISAVVTAGDRTEKISVWKESSDTMFVFLPSYARLEQVRLQVGRDDVYEIGGRPLVDGMSCGGFETGVAYGLTAHHEEVEFNGTITFVQSGNVETLYLDVVSGSMEHIHEVKGNEEPAVMRLYGTDGQLLYRGNVESVNGRGHSSWKREKKPYSLELMAEADLLGMGTAKKWILQANAMDPSNLRNKIAYGFAEAAGIPAPDCEWVDLYLNGEYAGLYLLCERNEIHPQRVDIPEEGSFLVVKDWPWRFREDERPYFMTENNAALRIHYADMDTDMLQAIWQTAENAILAEDGTDPATGKNWQELIDLNSWAKKYLVEEIFGNVDGTTLSQFFYYDGSDPEKKIYAGPVWDYDLSMGNTISVPENGEQMFFANRAGIYGSPWPWALYQKEAFHDALTEQYETVFRPLLGRLLETEVEEYAAKISAAAAMNRIRWDGTEAEEETRAILDYMNKRMAFLDSLWIGGDPYCIVEVRDDGDFPHWYAVRQGETMPRLKTYVSDENTVYHGWYYRETNEPVDFSRPVEKDMTVYLRYEENAQTEVSAPEEAAAQEAPEEEKAQAEEGTQKQAVPQEEAAVQETEKTEVQQEEPAMETEAVRTEEPAGAEGPSLLRLSPLILFLLILAAVSLAGLYQMGSGGRNIFRRS